MENKFKELVSLNVNEHTEKKKSGNTELTYLSWAWAWAEFKKVYPDATYFIQKFENNLPYVFDINTGYMVFTEVKAGGISHEMWLPVMDGANKAMKKDTYKYETKYNGTKTVEPANMFDVNKTLMRCLVKNLAMFGLGLYIYAGEDLPEEDKDDNKTPVKQMKELDFEEFKQAILDCNDLNLLQILWKENAINFTNEKEKVELTNIKNAKKDELWDKREPQDTEMLSNKLAEKYKKDNEKFSK